MGWQPAPRCRKAFLVAMATAVLGARTAQGLSSARLAESPYEPRTDRALGQATTRLARLWKPSDDKQTEEEEEEGDGKGEKEGEEDQDEADKPGEKSEASGDDDEEEEEEDKKKADSVAEKERSEDEAYKEEEEEDKHEEGEAKPSSEKTEDGDDDEKEEDRDDGPGRKEEKGKEADQKRKDENGNAKTGTRHPKQEPKVPAPREATNERGEPVDPGCYVLMPDGCPGKSWGPTPWKRDFWGEANVGAGTDRDVCENKRKIKFNNWCGKDNARMLFVEGPPAYPSEPGCFYWQPSGCPAHGKGAAKEWVRDESDEGIGQAACEVKRRVALDKWCKVSDTKTLFVRPKPESPEYPGCYVWMPSGCARHKFDARRGWKRDAWGEDHSNAGQDRAVCERRKFSFNTWCGISDARMLFVGAET